MQRNLSREAHLWYVITSPDYVQQAQVYLQDAFNYFLSLVRKDALASDYTPVPYWGGVMEDLLANFPNALAALKQGEFTTLLGWGGRLGDIPRGLNEGVRWMSNDEYEELQRRIDLANRVVGVYAAAIRMSQEYSDAAYIDGTQDWRICMPEDIGITGDDIARYYEEPVYHTIPAEIPEYAPDTSVSCKTGEIVPWTGVWVPARGMGTAALVFARKQVQIMQPSYEILRMDENNEYAEEYELVATTFHPVRPTGRMIPFSRMPVLQEERLRCESGQPCPQGGYWFTPAKADSRRAFKQGDIMPAFESDYGSIIWQWDSK